MSITATEAGEAAEFAGVGTLMKDTSVVWVHDAETGVTYKASIRTLADAVARLLVEDGVIPGEDE